MSDPLAGRHPGDLAFPRQSARTQGFSLGIARSFVVAPGGERVAFLRSASGSDPVHALWVLDLEDGGERVVFAPGEHDPDVAAPQLTPAERARRERARERASGVVAFACDRDVTVATFVERGRLFHVELTPGGRIQELPTPGVPDDPRPSPDGAKVAYVVDGVLYVQDVGGVGCVVASDDAPDTTWGLPDFAAAEEMGRMRGFWWSPDGRRIAACRVDESAVQTWWISDASTPGSSPYAIRYPQAGTPNAEVTLHVFDVETGAGTEVRWDRQAFEYLAAVRWDGGAPLTLLVQSRDQTRTQLLEAADDGGTAIVHEDADPAWVDLVAGAPARLDDGTLVVTQDAEDRKRIVVGGSFATPATIHVESVLGTSDDTVWFRGWEDDPTEGHVFRVSPPDAPARFTSTAGDHVAITAGPVVVVRSYGAEEQHPSITVHRQDPAPITLTSCPEEPVVDPRPSYAVLGQRELRAALLLPGGREPDGPLPILLSPYGGPHHAEVVHWRGAYRPHQWFADRLGAAVLVIDGRGTPGRGASWERQVHLDLSVTLQDQVDGLQAAAQRWPFLDLDHVGIRGWSFGGMVSALAVCTRPDVFHTAVAGAPVTDQHLYDTHYTERYLGMPSEQPEAYRISSPLSFATDLRRPLLLIHGLADDNVVAAHSLQMAARLFEAGIAHDLVLLPNASHMGGAGGLVVARYLAELDFLRRTLELPVPR